MPDRSAAGRSLPAVTSFLKKRRHRAGLPPGTLVSAEDDEARPPAALSVIEYDADRVEERALDGVADALPLRDTAAVSWINIVGVHDVEAVRTLGEHFGLHPLVLEDIASTGQRPKMEEHEDYLFLLLKMLTYDEERRALHDEQVSLIVGRTWVLCFQEAPGDVFDPVRRRIRDGRGRLRTHGASYLAYALVDVIVDHYFIVLEGFGTQAEDLEDQILGQPDSALQTELNALRRNLVLMRRAVWPLREMMTALEKSTSPLLEAEIRPFLRDTYDHVVQVIDLAESLREMLNGLHDLYMSTLSNRMNEIVKVLTIISTLFIPITFIAGLYGMNFAYMPELGYRYAYPTTLALMLAIAVALLFYFRKKGWI